MLRELTFFSICDYAVFAIMLLASVSIGIISKSMAKDRFFDGKTIGAVSVTLSIISSHVSGVMLIGTPAHVYQFGAIYVWSCFSEIAAFVLVVGVFLPIFREKKVETIFQYLEERFDSDVKKLMSILNIPGVLLYSSLTLYTCGLAISSVAGIDLDLVIPISCAVCVFYTVIGGLRGVIWTEAFHFVVTLSAVLFITFLGIEKSGGVEALWMKSLKGSKLDIFDFRPDPCINETFWAYTLGRLVISITTLGLTQESLQKYLSITTAEGAKRSIIYSGIVLVLVNLLVTLNGLILFAIFRNNDPLVEGAIENYDQLVPYHVMEISNQFPGLPGLFIAGIFNMSLGKLSAILNAVAGVLYKDFIAKIWPKTNEYVVTNCFVVIFGTVCSFLVFLMKNFGSLFSIPIKLSSLSLGPTLGLFVLAFFIPKANAKGVICGIIFSVLTMGWFLVTVQQLSKNDSSGQATNFSKSELQVTYPESHGIFAVSYQYYPLMGCILTVTTGCIASIIANKIQKYRENRLQSFLLQRKMTTSYLKYGAIAGSTETINSFIP